MLEHVNNQVQELINTVDDLLTVIDENGRIHRVNQAWIDFCLAHELGQAFWKIGGNFFEQLELWGKEKEMCAIQQVLAGQIDEHKQMYRYTLNGGQQCMQVKIRKIQLASDQCGVIIYHRPATFHTEQDITAETVLESMTDGFVLLNDDFQITYLNEIAEQLLSCRREDLVGSDLVQWFPKESNPSFHAAFERGLSEQTVVEVVDYFTALDTWFQVKVCPLKKGGLALYFQDISEKKKTEVQLMESAYYDYLTGLPNRRSIIETIQSQIEHKVPCTVFHIHLDNLNFINAVHNHNTGEAIMIKIAQELKAFTTETCHVGRLDGSEFIVVRKPKKGENMAVFAEQIEEIFHKQMTLDPAKKVSVTASIGIACHPFDAKTLDELLSYAEIAMCEAKNARGSSHAFFRPKMKVMRNRSSVIEKRMRGDLKDSGFYYALQPQIDGATGRIVGVEVLSRWAHPELGELSPLEFIEVAEETENIIPLSLHLLQEVLAQIKDWENRFGWNLQTAINMSPSLISNGEFFDDFFGLIDFYQVHPSLIEIEITEQAELTYSPKTLENLLICKSKGMSIAIDDFGTGFSMISYLTHFPINKIKIDRSFTQKIGRDAKSEAVLKSLINLANSIECDLVAEGVERVEEADFLRENGCNIYQGYLYDRPLKVNDFEAKYLQSAESRFFSSSLITRP